MQKSGYFSRFVPRQRGGPAADPLHDGPAVECALRGEAGVIGHDEEHGDRLKAIEFPRINGGKAFDIEPGLVP